MSVRGGLVAAVGTGLLLTLGGAAATAAPTVAPQLRQLYKGEVGVTPPEICNLYQSPNNTRASICSAASSPGMSGQPGVVDGYYRGTLTGAAGYIQVRVNSTVETINSYPTAETADFRGIWTDASSVQFRACGYSGGCGPWK
ncbi:hypothetical protein ACIA49_02215 [Kribbella sp. NPDC051587]|uniref:hypothetical protein n=1 Tax=Kribbella sp. NPDC051587 TaxID=3364119 RepID=UPI0037A38158